MSCTAFSQIPSPPTIRPSCAVPIGGSNSSILDACCNGEVNPIATYFPPSQNSSSSSSSNATANADSDDGCFQYCAADSTDGVWQCLADKLGSYRKDGKGPTFECFNNAEGGDVRKGTGGGHSSDAGVGRGRVGWAMGVVLGLGVVAAVVGGA